MKSSSHLPGLKIKTVIADVLNEAAVKNYGDETIKTFDHIDGFYNNGVCRWYSWRTQPNTLEE
jgi:hypothetical protein